MAFKKALDIMNTKRISAQIGYNKKLLEVYEKIPEICEMKKALSTTSIKISKLLFKGQKTDVFFKNKLNQIKINNLDIQASIKELLVENSYPENYLQLDYSCNICNDTGYKLGSLCECFKHLIKKIKAKELINSSNLNISSFQSFDLSLYPEEFKNKMKEIYLYCIKYSDNFNINSNNIFMMGNTGLGKTHLSFAIANNVINSGFNVIYGSAQDLFRSVESEHFGKVSSLNSTLDTIIYCDLLIIDDVGTEFESNFYSSLLYNIINSRINLSKPIIINSNLNQDDIFSRYSDRVVSRLISFDILKFYGNDIRLIKKQNKT
ncbi:MAG: ATP-binding protein [Oscillospiraceae bacterium]|nr:ATP-binding protein [Oscillospiraceae bacterium]